MRTRWRKTKMSGARILLIEDDEILCDLVSRNLLVRQHEVQIAMDGLTALACLRTHSFDLVLLDINLPDQTGWDVLRTAQSEHLFRPQTVIADPYTIPVIILSAVRVSSRRLAEFHTLAYLPKPFPMEALLRFASKAAARRALSSIQSSE